MWKGGGQEPPWQEPEEGTLATGGLCEGSEAGGSTKDREDQ